MEGDISTPASHTLAYARNEAGRAKAKVPYYLGIRLPSVLSCPRILVTARLSDLSYELRVNTEVIQYTTKEE